MWKVPKGKLWHHLVCPEMEAGGGLSRVETDAEKKMTSATSKILRPKSHTH